MFNRRPPRRYLMFQSMEDAEKQIPEFCATEMRFGEKDYCVARTKDEIFVTDNACPHQGGPLGRGHCTPKGEIVCPWHKYSFDLKTGRQSGGAGDYVEVYKTEKDDSGIYVLIPRSFWDWF